VYATKDTKIPINQHLNQIQGKVFFLDLIKRNTHILLRKQKKYIYIYINDIKWIEEEPGIFEYSGNNFQNPYFSLFMKMVID